jgi:hypothetical protein
MLKINYFAVLICLLFSACKAKEIKLSTDYTIINIENPANISIENLIDDYDTIRLETTDESLLQGVSQLHIMDDKLYVMDGTGTAVFIFSNTGKYLTKIHAVGQASDEYVKIRDFYMDYINKQIVITDLFSKKIIIYDRMGNHQNTTLLNFMPVRIVPSKTGFIHFCSEPKTTFPNKEMETTNIHFLDENGKFTHAMKQDDTPLTIEVRSVGSVVNLRNGTFLYQPVISDTVYFVDENSVEIKYIFHSKSKYKIPSYKERQNISFSFADKNTVSHIKDMINSNYLFSWGEIKDLDNYFYAGFSGLLENDQVKVYYSKNKNKAVTVSSNTIKGNKSLISIFLNAPFMTYNNYFYTTIPSRLMHNETSVNELPEGKLKTFILNTNLDDTNPLLIKFSLNNEIFN